MKRIMPAWVVFFLVAADQATKYLVRSRLALGESVPVLPFFQLTYITNTGVAFGMFNESAGANLFFIFLTLIILAAVIYSWLRYRAGLTRWTKAALTLVIAGALGNLVDRVLFGRVIDFADVFFGSWHFYIFNVADSCITIGGAILVVTTLAGDRAHHASDTL